MHLNYYFIKHDPHKKLISALRMPFLFGGGPVGLRVLLACLWDDIHHFPAEKHSSRGPTSLEPAAGGVQAARRGAPGESRMEPCPQSGKGLGFVRDDEHTTC